MYEPISEAFVRKLLTWTPSITYLWTHRVGVTSQMFEIFYYVANDCINSMFNLGGYAFFDIPLIIKIINETA